MLPVLPARNPRGHQQPGHPATTASTWRWPWTASRSARNRYTILSAVCMGTLYHTAALVSPEGGVPASKDCLAAFKKMWLDWAGPPQRLVLDRGTHNRGVFSENINAMGIELRFIGTEAPFQGGRFFNMSLKPVNSTTSKPSRWSLLGRPL